MCSKLRSIDVIELKEPDMATRTKSRFDTSKLGELNESDDDSPGDNKEPVTFNLVEALDHRLRALVSLYTSPTRRNSQMAQMTGVDSSQWASWWAGRARPSAEILAATCTAFPEHALWLMTGVDDALGGQLGPDADWKPQHATRLLRWLSAKAGHHREQGAMDGFEIGSELEAEELAAMIRLRAKELAIRLKEKYGDQAA